MLRPLALGGGPGRPRASRSRRSSTGTATRTKALPWDHISAGLHRDFLWRTGGTPWPAGAVEDCRWTPCYDCGACTGLGLEHVVASTVPPAGGSQGTGQDLSSGGAVPVEFTRAVGSRAR